MASHRSIRSASTRTNAPHRQPVIGLERLEVRRLFSVKLYGITGNQQNGSYPDETLFQIDYTSTPGTLNLTNLKKLPYVPDTDAIGYNPETGLLHHVSGASSYRNNPVQIGYRDDQFMETVDVRSPTLTEVGIFNANYDGEPGFGPYGIPAPFPTWVSPSERRTDDQTAPIYGERGLNEYSAARDLTWSPDQHLFYLTASEGIYTLTADGATSTFIGAPGGLAGGPKGLTFATVGGQRRLLVSERDGGNLYTVDPTTAQVISSVTVQEPGGTPSGILSIVEDTDGTLIAIAKSISDPSNAFARDLIRIDPSDGTATTLGTFNVHMADLAIVHDGPETVTGQRVFYNNGIEDGTTAAASPQDDSAVDYEKAPINGVTAAPENITSTAKGLNGIMIDVSGAPAGTLLPGDFAIRSATLSAPLTWAAGPAPLSVTVRRGAGVGGTDRVTLIWNDYSLNSDPANEAIANGYLEVTMLANTDTKLLAPSTFRYANLIGDFNGNGSVNTLDYATFRQHYAQPADTISGTDLNHDGACNNLDFALFRSTFGKALPPPPALLIAAARSSLMRVSAMVLGREAGE